METKHMTNAWDLTCDCVFCYCLTEHVDVALGDGVEAAAREQDDVRLGALRHGAGGGMRT